jgi:hypothetical protein
MKLVFDIAQLKNLHSLHEHEETLRDESLGLLAKDTKHAEMLFLVANAMGILFGFCHDHKAEGDDELTLQYFGLRIFNAAGASIKLALTGYAQQALVHTRDIMEVAFLLDYFSTFPAEISLWKSADERTLKTTFAPVHIREALDARDGNKEQKRRKVYSLLSTYASHATYAGFTMTMKDGEGQLGPFVDERKLKAWLQELALRLLPAAEIFGRHFPTAPAAVLSLYRSYAHQVIEWAEKNQFGIKGQSPARSSDEA